MRVYLNTNDKVRLHSVQAEVYSEGHDSHVHSFRVTEDTRMETWVEHEEADLSGWRVVSFDTDGLLYYER